MAKCRVLVPFRAEIVSILTAEFYHRKNVAGKLRLEISNDVISINMMNGSQGYMDSAETCLHGFKVTCHVTHVTNALHSKEANIFCQSTRYSDQQKGMHAHPQIGGQGGVKIHIGGV